MPRSSPRPSTAPSTRDKPRELGSHYTPALLARWIVDQCWPSPGTTPLGRVLDPACGDGAFLLAVFDLLVTRSAEQQSPAPATFERRLQLVQDHLFGVDLDSVAVDTLRHRLLARLAPTDPADETAALAVLHANIHCGDALLGPDFSLPPLPTRDIDPSRPAPLDPATLDPVALDWRAAFPDVAASGGFDAVIGNPPYLRERHAKPLFDRLAVAPLGRKWRQARMDLWYYFVHRSLDLLQPGGLLSFIVNSYWTASSGAGKLIDRLQRETELQDVVLLEASPVFAGVVGRHMIFRLAKRAPTAATADSASSRVTCRIRTATIAADTDPSTSPSLRVHSEYRLPHADLFQHGRLVLAPPDPAAAPASPHALLGDVYDTRQGMAENPPVINRRLAREFDGVTLGAGVFVLTPAEVAALDLAPHEQALLRPYYETRALARHAIGRFPTHHVLYLTRRTAPDLDALPRIRDHLSPFRPILERRREVQSGGIRWWHLHWPRDESIFKRPRILSVQMGRVPQFVYCGSDQPTYVGFSINIILDRPPAATMQEHVAEDSRRESAGAAEHAPTTLLPFPLETLADILNSAWAARWFDRHAKRRGVNLDINARVLQQYPLPRRHAAIEAELATVRHARRETIQAAARAELDARTNALVDALYAERD